jgi:hypothetical protein
MSIGQRNAKHRARQNLGHRPDEFNWFFFGHVSKKQTPPAYAGL